MANEMNVHIWIFVWIPNDICSRCSQQIPVLTSMASEFRRRSGVLDLAHQVGCPRTHMYHILHMFNIKYYQVSYTYYIIKKYHVISTSIIFNDIYIHIVLCMWISPVMKLRYLQFNTAPRSFSSFSSWSDFIDQRFLVGWMSRLSRWRSEHPLNSHHLVEKKYENIQTYQNPWSFGGKPDNSLYGSFWKTMNFYEFLA